MISLKEEDLDPQHVLLQIMVKDTGCGMVRTFKNVYLESLNKE